MKGGSCTDTMQWKIKVGDYVEIYFDHVSRVLGTVRSIPQATGDCWVIEDVVGEEAHYVQTFARMTKQLPRR